MREHPSFNMRKYLILQRFRDMSEAALAASLVACFGSYAINYYVCKCPLAMRLTAIFVAITAGIRVLLTCYMRVFVAHDADNLREFQQHEFLSGLKNRKSAYAWAQTNRVLRHTRVWRHFVRGVNWQVVTQLIAIAAVAAATTLALIACIMQSWGFTSIIIPVCIVVLIVCGFLGYRKVHHVFRSGDGFVMYLLRTKHPLTEVDADFNHAQVVSKRMRVSYQTVYFRDRSKVFVMDFADVTSYQLYTKSIKMESSMYLMGDVLNDLTQYEYEVLATKLLM